MLALTLLPFECCMEQFEFRLSLAARTALREVTRPEEAEG